MSTLKTEQIKGVISLNGGFPFGLLLASGIFIADAVIFCNDGGCEGENEVLAVIVGSVLLLMVLVNNIGIILKLIQGKIEFILSFFMLALWGFSAFFTTLEGPFDGAPTNGFMAAWIGLLMALGNFLSQEAMVDRFRGHITEMGVQTAFIFTGSVLVATSSIGVFEECCNEEEVLGLVAGGFSAIICLIRLFMGPGPTGLVNTNISIFLSVWWLVTGVFLTFSLFEVLNNGYMGVAIALLSSLYMLHQSNKKSPLF